MPIPCAVLMCHAPIVVPEVAGDRAGECADTTRAMAAAAERVLAHEPDAVVVVSPHAPRDRSRFGVCGERWLRGDFTRFDAGVEIRLPGAPELAAAVRSAAEQLDVGTCELRGGSLDHGALVPLYFLQRAGHRGPTLLVALPYPEPGAGSERLFGRALAAAAEQLGQRVCVVASGDMSHRLAPGAPAGYHPRAREFDERFCALIGAGDLRAAIDVDLELRDLAAEDVVDPCAVAAGAVDFAARAHRVLYYEGPFGVGYMEAVLHDDGAGGAP